MANLDPGGTSEGPLMSRMALNDNKAGMEGLDKEKINQIIYNASKGSKFYENERKKEEQLNEKIKEQQLWARSISVQKLREGQHQADIILETLLQHRDLGHTIVHVDMDAYYAAVEMRDNPTLVSKPMAVGGMGMLSTSNYLARKFGVRAAMPGFIGLKLCPDLIIVKPNFDKYTAVSQQVRQVLAVYDPNFCPMSLDEAYLDFGPHLQYRAGSLPSARTFILRVPPGESAITEADESMGSICTCDLNCVLLPAFLDLEQFSSSELNLEAFVQDFDSRHAPDSIPQICNECKKSFPKYCLKVYGRTIEEAVLEMRNRIEQHTSLTASAGIAPNLMLAKVCSDKNKPNGQYRIPSDILAVEEFVRDLPIRKISGIGKVSEKLLGAIGVSKCCDIYEHRAVLYHLFSQTSFQHFLRIYLGIGSTVVERDEEKKSISTEQTFSEISDRKELCSKCDEMSESLAQDLTEEHLKGKTVTLKIKTVSFEVKTRSQTLQNATSNLSVISSTAKNLLLAEIKNSHPAPLRLRLMGVRMSKLMSEEKKEVNVKDMFLKLAAGSSSSYNQRSFRNSDTNVLIDDVGQNDIINTSADKWSSSDGTNTVTKSSQSKQKITCSESITTFVSKETLDSLHNNDSIQEGNTHFNSISREVVPLENFSSVIHQDCSILSCNYELKSSALEEIDKSSIGRPRDSLSSDADKPSVNVQDLKDSCSQKLTCPVCGMTELDWDLKSLNGHMDVCLSRQTIREMLHNDKMHENVSPSSSFSSTVSQPSKKRVKTEEETGQQKNEKPKKIQRTVISFFHK